jgi:hypothetical protein
MMKMVFHIGRKMIDNIVNLLFKWDRLRYAIFSEVDLYNTVTRIMADPEASSIATAMWDEGDGWRGWTIKDNGSYYFHDVPEHSLGDMMHILMDKENV